MFKLVAFFAVVIAAVNAGIIAHAPTIAIAQSHHHPQSYANSNLLAVHPVPVAVAHSAPVHVAAPVAVGISHGAILGGHGLGLGGQGLGLGGHGVGLGGQGLGLGGHGLGLSSHGGW